MINTPIGRSPAFHPPQIRARPTVSGQRPDRRPSQRPKIRRPYAGESHSVRRGRGTGCRRDSERRPFPLRKRLRPLGGGGNAHRANPAGWANSVSWSAPAAVFCPGGMSPGGLGAFFPMSPRGILCAADIPGVEPTRLPVARSGGLYSSLGTDAAFPLACCRIPLPGTVRRIPLWAVDPFSSFGAATSYPLFPPPRN